MKPLTAHRAQQIAASVGVTAEQVRGVYEFAQEPDYTSLFQLDGGQEIQATEDLPREVIRFLNGEDLEREAEARALEADGPEPEWEEERWFK